MRDLAIRATRPGPRVLLLALTMRCNARCVMCTIWRAEPKSMTSDLLAGAFADGVLGRQLEYLGLTGGEPSTLKAFGELSRYAIDQCPKLREVSFNTNGFATYRTLNAVESVLAATEPRGIRLRLYVSLDGVGEVHDRVRGLPGVFPKTVRTIEALQELAASRNCDVSINSVVTRQNAEHVRETLGFAHQLGVPINFSLSMDTDVCINSAASDVAFEILPEQIPELRRTFARIRAFTRARSGDGIEDDYYAHLIGMLDHQPRTLGCPFAEAAGCLIDPWGDVYPCGVSRTLLMGNVGRASFGTIWQNEATWKRLDAELPTFCSSCESNCFVHASERLQPEAIR